MSLVKRWVLGFVAPKPLVGALHLPRYFRDWRRFRKAAPGTAGIADSYPCLLDWSPATPFDPHYFYQGAWLARELETVGTTLHVDVGSSVMMVSVLSARVPTVFVDYRPLVASLPGLLSVAGDIGRLPFGDASLASVSALHVLEHIGLGPTAIRSTRRAARAPLANWPAWSRPAAGSTYRCLPAANAYVSTHIACSNRLPCCACLNRCEPLRSHWLTMPAGSCRTPGTVTRQDLNTGAACTPSPGPEA